MSSVEASGFVRRADQSLSVQSQNAGQSTSFQVAISIISDPTVQNSLPGNQLLVGKGDCLTAIQMHQIHPKLKLFNKLLQVQYLY